MNADNRLIGTLMMAVSLFLVGITHGSASAAEATIEQQTSKGSGIHEAPSRENPDAKADEPGGLLQGTLHIVLVEERTKALSEIDKQRQATLAYLTQERSVVMDELENALNRVADLLHSERRETVVEMEAIGNRIVENAILKSERLIDHFFIRAMQMALIVILIFSLAGVVIVRVAAKKRSASL